MAKITNKPDFSQTLFRGLAMENGDRGAVFLTKDNRFQAFIIAEDKKVVEFLGLFEEYKEGKSVACKATGDTLDESGFVWNKFITE